MFDLLCDRHQASLRHRDLMLAQIAAVGVNFSMSRPQQPVSVEDLMLRQPGERRAKQTKGPSKRALAHASALNLKMAFMIQQAKAKLTAGATSTQTSN